MTPVYGWAEMRAILMFINGEGQSHKTVSADPNFSRERCKSKMLKESKQGLSAYQPNALLLGQAVWH